MDRFFSFIRPKKYLFSLALALNSESFIPQSLKNFSVEGSPGLISTILDLLFALSGVVAVFYIIWGGYQYIISAGGETAENAKKTITNAIIGLIIIIAAWAIVSFVLSRLGASTESTGSLTGP